MLLTFGQSRADPANESVPVRFLFLALLVGTLYLLQGLTDSCKILSRLAQQTIPRGPQQARRIDCAKLRQSGLWAWDLLSGSLGFLSAPRNEVECDLQFVLRLAGGRRFFARGKDSQRHGTDPVLVGQPVDRLPEVRCAQLSDDVCCKSVRITGRRVVP